MERPELCHDFGDERGALERLPYDVGGVEQALVQQTCGPQRCSAVDARRTQPVLGSLHVLGLADDVPS